MSCNSEELAISVKNVTKAYKIFDNPSQRLMHHLFRVNNGRDFIALDDVSFNVKKGESFGIIGRNGSGKSTMLQILAGIIKATSGEITVNGRIAALLELGSGFDPECTGYENIYMNAAILGVSKEDIDAKVNQIIEFADIGDFVNQPVKTYSSGMFVRLAFAVAINVDADILLIDEALAVGDVFFRQKCYKKLNELKEEGKTIILVSHGMNEVEQFCDRVLLLNKSKTLMCGDSREAVQQYYLLDQEKNGLKVEKVKTSSSIHKNQIQSEKKTFSIWNRADGSAFNCDIEGCAEVNSGKVRFLNVGIFDSEGMPVKVFHQGEYAFFCYEVEILEDISVPLMGIVFYDQRNRLIFGKDNLQAYMVLPNSVGSGRIVRCLFKIKMDIAIGEYTFDAGFNTINELAFEKRSEYNQEEINNEIERLCCLSKVGNFAIHQRIVGEPMKEMFHGCCDLQNETELIIE